MLIEMVYDFRKYLIGLFMLTMVIQVIWFFPILHEPIPIHFNLSGYPVSWTSKKSFISLYTVVNSCLLITYFLSIKFLSLLPNFTNIPNKSYWIAIERRHITTLKISKFLHSIWISTILFILGLWQAIINTNFSPNHRLGFMFFLILTLYILYIIPLFFSTYRTFK